MKQKTAKWQRDLYEYLRSTQQCTRNDSIAVFNAVTRCFNEEISKTQEIQELTTSSECTSDSRQQAEASTDQDSGDEAASTSESPDSASADFVEYASVLFPGMLPMATCAEAIDEMTKVSDAHGDLLLWADEVRVWHENGIVGWRWYIRAKKDDEKALS